MKLFLETSDYQLYRTKLKTNGFKIEVSSQSVIYSLNRDTDE